MNILLSEFIIISFFSFFRYFNHFKSYFNLLFIVDIMYIMVMTCLCASSVLLANGFSAFHIKMMSLLIVVVSQFFFYCLIGEKFSLMVNSLLHTFINNFRKILNAILRFSDVTHANLYFKGFFMSCWEKCYRHNSLNMSNEIGKRF